MIIVITKVITADCSITFVKTFADRLRETRQQKDISQEELAKACGIAQSTVGNYETLARKKPSGPVLIRMARTLGVTAEWLMEGDPAPRIYLYEHPTSSQLRDEAVAGEKPYWPFSRIAPHDYWSLSQRERDLVENAVASLIKSLNRPDKADK